jgi:hypothetical protein
MGWTSRAFGSFQLELGHTCFPQGKEARWLPWASGDGKINSASLRCACTIPKGTVHPGERDPTRMHMA